MSNKFKKAVAQRTSEEELVEIKLDEKSEEVIKNDSGNEKNSELNDIENMDYSVVDMLEMKDEKKAKNKTYYLEESVIKAVVQISKKKKMSESKVVNDILKHILKIK